MTLKKPGNQTGSVLCFGELLLRISPDADGEWLKNNQLPFYIGGAELNVATALALWGLPTKYFTVLPDNSLSAQIVDSVNERNIDTSPIHFAGDRIGLYYLTKGYDLKHDALIYDRANSAFSKLMPGLIDWDKVLDGVSWFHFSAICPAISQNVADLCAEVLEAASKKNIIISVDLNYRSKLWQYGRLPNQIMPKLVKYCDLIMGNVWAAEIMLDIPIAPDVNEPGQKSVYLNEALKSSIAMIEKFPKCSTVAHTFRFDGLDNVKYYTSLYTDNRFYNSKEYQTAKVTDRVGSGDCFMAGLIHGFYNDLQPEDLIEFATAAAFGKLFITGDATTQTAAEIKEAIK